MAKLDKTIAPEPVKGGKAGPDGKPVKKILGDPATLSPDGTIPTPKAEIDGLTKLNTVAIDLSKNLAVGISNTAKSLEKLTLTAGKIAKLPQKFVGGPVAANETFIGAELGPELAKHGDGSFSLLQTPGIYTLDRAANILTANETQNMIQNADTAIGSTFSSTAIGSRSMVMAGGMGGGAIVAELKHLRSIVSSRKPEVQVPVTFSGPVDNGVDKEFAKLSRMLIRSSVM